MSRRDEQQAYEDRFADGAGARAERYGPRSRRGRSRRSKRLASPKALRWVWVAILVFFAWLWITTHHVALPAAPASPARSTPTSTTWPW